MARLENDLLICLVALRSYGPIEQVSREMLHQIRDLTIIVRNRKLKPEKGGRKDLHKIDSLIVDLVSTLDKRIKHCSRVIKARSTVTVSPSPCNNVLPVSPLLD